VNKFLLDFLKLVIVILYGCLKTNLLLIDKVYWSSTQKSMFQNCMRDQCSLTYVLVMPAVIGFWADKAASVTKAHRFYEQLIY
jgi:hypothetical protein